MMHVSVPMYDQAEVQIHNDILCQVMGRLAKRYAREALGKCLNDDERMGLEEIINHPFKPSRNNCLELWDDTAHILFSQICGQLYYEKYTEKMLPICTPVYICSGTNKATNRGYYRALIIVHKSNVARFTTAGIDNQSIGPVNVKTDAKTADVKTCCCKSSKSLIPADNLYLRSLAGARLAINAPDSYSGCVSIRNAVALALPTTALSSDSTRNIFFHPDVVTTGSHRASVAAVASGAADVASIDCTTWAILARHCSAEVAACEVIGATAAAPAPPFVVSKNFAARCPRGVEVLRRAITETLSHRHQPVSFATSPVLDAEVEAPTVDAEILTQADANTLKVALTMALDALGIDGAISDPTTVGPEHYISAFRELSSVPGSAVLSPLPLHSGARCGDSNININSSAGVGVGAGGLDQLDYLQRVDLCGYQLSFPYTTAYTSSSNVRTVNSDADVDASTDAIVRRWMDRAMLLGYGFNHEAAVFCCEEALKLDPSCVLAHWGIAYNLGENYNVKEPEPEDTVRARRHVDLAMKLLDAAPEGRYSSLEAGLIKAIKCRCDLPASEAATMTIHYSVAMKSLYVALSSNCDIAALYAESLINIRPWRLWEPRAYSAVGAVDIIGDTKPAHPDTVELGIVLEQALAITPRHPGLCHLYVHYGELGPRRVLFGCVPYAHMLRSQWPFLGHLLHMASHIDMQVGMYEHAIRCNQEGIRQDILYNQYRSPEGSTDHFYHGYRVHNGHMLTWAAMFNGNFEVALAASEANCSSMSAPLFRKWIHYMEPYMTDSWHVLIRFGRWKEILQRPLRCSLPGALDSGSGGMVYETMVMVKKGDSSSDGSSVDTDGDDNKQDEDETVFVVDRAFGRYAKGIAHAALGNVAAARAQQALFHRAVARIPASRCLHNVPSDSSMKVAECMLAGEIDFSAGEFESAFENLREAVRREELLPYDEPPGWMFPSRHALGALALERATELLKSVLLPLSGPESESTEQKQSRVVAAENGIKLLVEAEAAYATDLLHYANNLWSLVGRRNCVRLLLSLALKLDNSRSGNGSGSSNSILSTALLEPLLVGTPHPVLVVSELRAELAVRVAEVMVALSHSSPEVRAALCDSDSDNDDDRCSSNVTGDLSVIGGASCFCAGKGRGRQ